MAKLQFRDIVNQGDVDQAINLMDYSIRSLRTMSGKDKDRRDGRKLNQQTDRFN